MLRTRIGLIVVWAAAVAPLFAQSDSRMAEIAAQQKEKAANPKPEEPKKIEKTLVRLKEGAYVERLSSGVGGWTVKFGGLSPETGFAIGPAYRRRGMMGGDWDFRGSVQASIRGSQRMELDLSAPRLRNGKFFAELNAVHRNYPKVSFYGIGPNSEKSGRTDFRLEDTSFDGVFGVRPVKHLSLAASAGYLLNNVGPGNESKFANTEQVYSPAQAPGIRDQADFFRSGGFIQYDWRDNPGGARRGGNYFAQINDYSDRTFGTSSFHRLDLEAQQYISVLNQRRVFAVRGKSTMLFEDGTQPVPFYMLPTLGGSEDLRGYRPYRFRGNNVFVMNGEYRWEVFSGLDMAVFADAGKVYGRRSDFTLSNLESDVGFGMRFNVRDQTFLRIDVGFSHEGFQVWVKFNSVFKRGPVRSSSSMGDF